MIYIEAPTEFDASVPAVFLAGGITDCPNWQQEATLLLDGPWAVLNPRRADFPIHDPSAAEAQVKWEYQHLNMADVVLFWFAAGPSPQPIALYELGARAAMGVSIAVGADPKYLRRTDVVLQLGHIRPELTVRDSLDAVCEDARQGLAEWSRFLAEHRPAPKEDE